MIHVLAFASQAVRGSLRATAIARRIHGRIVVGTYQLNDSCNEARFERHVPGAQKLCYALDILRFAEVWVDKGLHLDEAAFVRDMADADPRLCGMVEHLPVEKGVAIEPDLIALKRRTSLRGIRRLIEIEPNPTFCLEPDFIAGVKLVGKHGLSFDTCESATDNLRAG